MSLWPFRYSAVPLPADFAVDDRLSSDLEMQLFLVLCPQCPLPLTHPLHGPKICKDAIVSHNDQHCLQICLYGLSPHEQRRADHQQQNLLVVGQQNIEKATKTLKGLQKKHNFIIRDFQWIIQTLIFGKDFDDF